MHSVKILIHSFPGLAVAVQTINQDTFEAWMVSDRALDRNVLIKAPIDRLSQSNENVHSREDTRFLHQAATEAFTNTLGVRSW